jgi:hypothetical protein
MQYAVGVERYLMKIAPLHTKRYQVEGKVHSFTEISGALMVQVTISESLAEVEDGYQMIRMLWGMKVKCGAEEGNGMVNLSSDVLSVATKNGMGKV